LVAQKPQSFGLSETFRARGDELGMGLFYEEARPAKSAADQEKLDRAIAELSNKWLLRRYPWAGSLSTAHTLLYYDRLGPCAFQGDAARPRALPEKSRVAAARFDVLAIREKARLAEMAIWQHLVRERRGVSRAAYRELASQQAEARPSPRKLRY